MKEKGASQGMQAEHREAQPPVPHVIEMKEFIPKQAPRQPKEYHIGDTVTRENFVSFLIKSFAISRGHLPAQIKFFVWAEHKFGFDFRTTFTNMDIMSPNYPEFFSNEEKNLFNAQFTSVKAHDEVIDRQYSQGRETMASPWAYIPPPGELHPKYYDTKADYRQAALSNGLKLAIKEALTLVTYPKKYELLLQEVKDIPDVKTLQQKVLYGASKKT